MALTVVSIAYPLAPVRASAAGGAEQVLRLVEGELSARGYRSAVVARDDSAVSGDLFPATLPEAAYAEENRDAVTRTHQAAIDRALALGSADVVHMHGIDFDQYRVPRNLPVVVTLHLPPSWYPPRVWDMPDNYHFVCVSQSQLQACQPFTSRPLTVIANGVPTPSHALRHGPRGDYALMLSRICPEKNLHVGIDACRRAGIPVLLAGETYPYDTHLRYFHNEIEPRLGPQVRMLPSAGGADKQRLLAGARCLLLPTVAPETSSLVAMEALHAGIPVIAFPSGAIPEIVENGRTGFLVDDEVGMAAAIAETAEIDPAVCRHVAADRFSLARMVDDYLALYSAVLERSALPAGHRALPAVEVH